MHNKEFFFIIDNWHECGELILKKVLKMNPFNHFQQGKIVEN